MGKRPKVNIDQNAVAAANQAQADAVREQTAAQQSQADTAAKAAEARRVADENASALAAANANTLASNMNSQLSGENVANVVAGGTASDAGTPTSTMKKKRAGGSLSSQLGVNV